MIRGSKTFATVLNLIILLIILGVLIYIVDKYIFPALRQTFGNVATEAWNTLKPYIQISYILIIIAVVLTINAIIKRPLR